MADIMRYRDEAKEAHKGKMDALNQSEISLQKKMHSVAIYYSDIVCPFSKTDLILLMDKLKSLNPHFRIQNQKLLQNVFLLLAKFTSILVCPWHTRSLLNFDAYS